MRANLVSGFTSSAFVYVANDRVCISADPFGVNDMLLCASCAQAVRETNAVAPNARVIPAVTRRVHAVAQAQRARIGYEYRGERVTAPHPFAASAIPRISAVSALGRIVFVGGVPYTICGAPGCGAVGAMSFTRLPFVDGDTSTVASGGADAARLVAEHVPWGFTCAACIHRIVNCTPRDVQQNTPSSVSSRSR